MKKGLEVVAAILSIVAALATVASSYYAYKTSEADGQEKTFLAKMVYDYGAFVNKSVGLAPTPVVAEAPAPAPPAPQPPQAAPVQQAPAAITQETPYAQGDLYVSGFAAARRDDDVFLSFSIRNVSKASIFVAINKNESLVANTATGHGRPHDVKGVRDAWQDKNDPAEYTELAPDSEAFVSAEFNGRQLSEKDARFNINLLQLVGDKPVRHSFGRPVTIVEKTMQ
ncbi:hypothetical protein SAMN04488503_1766 [Humidesulfovibrio mexicanus]|uniref:Uncharacterized protein n=1 Tax=Humidesulfovibrio mexicanus TaxID=147047 RepID=A0A239A3L8_9BACT|nr:hypothetical protein [Humidesulfovibrio mexicanus]SNR89493.1 hypothetical protein SAMN04488503_1766 [Humidesulfovibrio mexicanus]